MNLDCDASLSRTARSSVRMAGLASILLHDFSTVLLFLSVLPIVHP
jgi:hypothetical protein